jgi:hypothetical protein
MFTRYPKSTRLLMIAPSQSLSICCVKGRVELWIDGGHGKGRVELWIDGGHGKGRVELWIDGGHGKVNNDFGKTVCTPKSRDCSFENKVSNKRRCAR